MEETETDSYEVKSSWNKIVQTTTKMGYVEGVSDGKASNYQKNFDEGYKEGFKNGFALGKCKGNAYFSRLLSSSNKDIHKNLENTRFGCCQMCRNENLVNIPKEEIIKVQNSYLQNILNNLQ